MNDLFLCPPYEVQAAEDNSAWNTPTDLMSDKRRYTFAVSFDMDPELDSAFYAQVVATQMLQVCKARALVRSAVIDDAKEQA